ncbi:MAG: helix-turn-helix domain-containing protein [Acidobacteria bacterium]|nr:helix-turn-helix domain-containing protein [Acidobacteriota bacterium]
MGWAARMSPALFVYIQTHLEEDLCLEVLSAKALLSPAHFQRTFQAQVGETPKNFVARLRLERAAFRLLIHDATLLEIALDCGFRNHETFTRAFRRRFGMAPSSYRTWVRTQMQERPALAAEQMDDAYSISGTKVRRLQRANLAFIRHTGPYEAVTDTLFDSLEDWANNQGLAGPRIWMGIGHDAPGVTRPEHLRFDAALVVPSAFTPKGMIGHQVFEGGEFAVTTHAGPFATLPAAYAAIFPRVTQLPKHQLIGVPAVEIYHTARVNARLRLNVTDICLPVLASGSGRSTYPAKPEPNGSAEWKV